MGKCSCSSGCNQTWVEEGAELASSNSSFEGDIDDDFEG